MAQRKKKAEWGERFRIRPGRACRLARLDPGGTPGMKKRGDAEEALGRMQRRLSDLQEVLYAGAEQALLVVIQAMDTGGKDGTIRHVFGPLNPQGVRVTSFKAPSGEELAHDYLWRIHAEAPRKGMIRIFNRSHYEDVLIARVHALAPKKEIERRYGQINAFEQYLSENGITILKFYLHISRKEQKKRLESRLARPDKHWKFDPGDLAERKRWDSYRRAYEKALSRCSTAWAPWHVIPADHKWYRNYAVARIVLETLQGMRLRYPAAPPDLDKVVVT
ncbi:MAG: polyphosphate kinase 2 family protein [Lentisphaerae bacterium]|nr:polyphosphate kinase 2 family protein [Lentisphaerota bacterium]